MTTNDLRFLLKEKYQYGESKTQEIIKLIQKNDLEQLDPNIIKDIHLLKSAYPLAYIIGFVDFLDCHIDLSLKTLIPRPETEYWVDQVSKSITLNHKLEILDIFCGSGCIGTAIAKKITLENHKINITFADINPSAIEQTKINFESNLKNDINVLPSYFISNVFENIPQQTYDYIFANPPYVSRNEGVGYSTKYEPQDALYPKTDIAVDFLISFLIDAHNYLKKSGSLFLETGGEKQINELMSNVKLRQLYSKIGVIEDQYQIPRVIKLEIYRA